MNRVEPIRGAEIQRVPRRTVVPERYAIGSDDVDLIRVRAPDVLEPDTDSALLL